jgi:hypothetical protein
LCDTPRPLFQYGCPNFANGGHACRLFARTSMLVRRAKLRM